MALRSFRHCRNVACYNVSGLPWIRPPALFRVFAKHVHTSFVLLFPPPLLSSFCPFLPILPPCSLLIFAPSFPFFLPFLLRLFPVPNRCSHYLFLFCLGCPGASDPGRTLPIQGAPSQSMVLSSLFLQSSPNHCSKDLFASPGGLRRRDWHGELLIDDTGGRAGEV